MMYRVISGNFRLLVCAGTVGNQPTNQKQTKWRQIADNLN